MAIEPMSVHQSSAFETSSGSSIPDSTASRTTPRSGTVGKVPEARQSNWRAAARRLAASLTLKLVALCGIFLALPVILYGQFEGADRHMSSLMTRAIEDRTKIIVEALAPMLRDVALSDPRALTTELAKYANDGIILKLIVRPTPQKENTSTNIGFYLVASSPPTTPGPNILELDEPTLRGILEHLGESCIADRPGQIRDLRPDGHIELIASVISIRTPNACWLLTSTYTARDLLNSSIGQPYWATRAMRVVAIIYFLLAMLTGLTALSIWTSLRRFGEVASEIGEGRIGDYAFSHRNIVPELAGVALGFDKLVTDLKRVSQQIRESAEDNAHSFKTPLAAIQSSLGPVRRALPPKEQRAQRAIEIMDSSIARLMALVNAAQRRDNNTADLIEAPRLATNLTQLVGESTLHFREIMAANDIRLVRRLDENVWVYAAKGMLEIVLQNILENATSFSPRGGTIVVILKQDSQWVEMRIDDEGPGIPSEKIDNIFERYFSFRPHPGEGKHPPHSGLGLWIVRRNIDTLGGTVRATNRLGGGLSITVVLPSHATHG